MTSARWWSVSLVLVLAVVGGCAADAQDDDRPTPAASDLNASAGQFRFDEGTRNVPTGVTNNSAKPITVTKAEISWDGFDWNPQKLPDDPVLPGQTAAFVSHFGRADCTTKPSAPRLLAVVNGVRRDLPLHVDQPGLFERLRTSVCAEQRLEDAASVTMSIGRGVRTDDGGIPSLPGTVDLRRAGASGDPVTVVDLGGSILFDVLPAEGRRLRPVTLSPASPALTIAIRVEPTRRCEPHARGNTSQPFLFSVFTRTGDDPVHRTITPPDKATQLRLWALLDRYCATVGSD